jgi:peptidoglycan/LPS O-acetylase OafA/YrhL
MATVVQLPEERLATRVRLPYLDGIRGVAAMYVVFAHISGFSGCPALFRWSSYAHYSVVAFIVLSGFSLMLPLSKNGDDSIPDLSDFALRRTRRILPPYYASLAISMALLLCIPAIRQGGQSADSTYDAWPVTGSVWPSLISHILLVHNWSNEWVSRINGPLWSVATEWQIYIIFPLLLLPLRKRFGGVSAVIIGFACGAFALISGVTRACPWFVGSFAVGMFASDLVSMRKADGSKALLVMAAFALSIPIIRRAFGTGPVGLELLDVAFSISFASMLIFMWHTPASMLVRFFGSRLPKTLGEFSYSIYVTHFPLLAVCSAYLPRFGTGSTHALALCAVLPLVIGAAYLFHLAFERPFMRWKTVA